MKNIITRFKGFFLLMAGIIWAKLAADPDVTTGTVVTWYNATSDKWKGQNEAGVVKTFATEEALASGIAFTQTYATATATVAARTANAITDNGGGASADGTIGAITANAALTDSTGGTPGTTFAAITAGAGYAQADMVAVKNALASTATQLNLVRTAIVALTDAVKELSTQGNANRVDGLSTVQALNKAIDALQAAGIAT